MESRVVWSTSVVRERWAHCGIGLLIVRGRAIHAACGGAAEKDALSKFPRTSLGSRKPVLI